MIDSFFNFLLSIRIPYEIISFLLGLLTGFAVYRRYGPECQRLKYEQAKEERQRKEAAAKRRLEAYTRRIAEKKAVCGFLWDRDGNPYCPTCGTLMQPFIKNQQGVLASFCPTCDKDKPGRGDHYCFLPEGKDLMEEVRKAFQKR